ncbi:MAG: hypothetical protein M0T77_02095 [Actinomycetota bacterium]|nr:hypothetical protein [Actinomycetota bacterium]
MSPAAQPPDEPLYDLLEPHITAERLAPCLAASAGNRRDAIRLYRWNIELSGAVYEALHVFEVVLRNAMDAQLRRWNATQVNPRTGQVCSSDWLLEPAPLLSRVVREQDLSKARLGAEHAVRHRQRRVSHADLLSQMSFGTWRFLLPSRDPGRRYLWGEALHAAFPHLNRTTHELVRSVDGIYQLRNRVAHLEPLLRSGNVRAQFNNIRTVLGEIDPDVEQWLISIQRVTTLLRARP